jgi:hypothetical protein
MTNRFYSSRDENWVSGHAFAFLSDSTEIAGEFAIRARPPMRIG